MTRPRFIAALLALITLVVYLPVRDHDFLVYDDNDYLTENPVVQNGLTWAGLKWAFTTWHANNWHPLTWLSHMVDCELFGLNAGAHHLVNVLFHASNSVLLFVLLWRLTHQVGAAAVVAALFAWHPLHVESVAWAAERKDVLSLFFGLLTLLAYADFATKLKTAPANAKISYGLALLFFTLGLLAKPMLVTLPFLLLLLDWAPLQRGFHPQTPPLARVILEKLPFLLLSATSCVITYLAQQEVAVVSVAQLPMTMRIGNALSSYLRYLGKTVWPANLAIPYPLPTTISAVTIATAGLVLLTITGLAWQQRRRQPLVLMGWLWFLGTLIPVIGLVQVGRQAMADRYTYLPHLGLFLAAIYGATAVIQRAHIPAIVHKSVVGLILLACVIRTEFQLRHWQDSESLFSHTIAVTPANAIAQINLGLALEQKGKRDEALAHYREAVRIDPTYVQAHNNLAILYDQMDRNNEAVAEYEVALRLNPAEPRTHCNFGTLLVKLARFEEALAQYREAARLAPADPLPFYLQGKAELRRGRSAIAVSHFREALQRQPDHLRSLTFLARVLAADPATQVRRGAEAVTLAERANALTSGNDGFVLDTLAIAYAEAGRFPEAQQIIAAILAAHEANHEPPPAALSERLALFRNGQPFRENFTNPPTEAFALPTPTH